MDDAFYRALVVVEQTIASVEHTIRRMDESLVCFTDFATQVEYYTRQRALGRLEGVGSLTPTTVLLIDSDEQARAYWSQSLKLVSPEFVILEAETATAGIALCRSRRITCVVVDLALSDRSGFEVLAALSPQVKRPAVAMVVLTKLVLASMPELALRNGAHAYLVKSRTSTTELDQAIRQAIATVGAMR